MKRSLLVTEVVFACKNNQNGPYHMVVTNIIISSLNQPAGCYLNRKLICTNVLLGSRSIPELTDNNLLIDFSTVQHSEYSRESFLTNFEYWEVQYNLHCIKSFCQIPYGKEFWVNRTNQIQLTVNLTNFQTS